MWVHEGQAYSWGNVAQALKKEIDSLKTKNSGMESHIDKLNKASKALHEELAAKKRAVTLLENEKMCAQAIEV